MADIFTGSVAPAVDTTQTTTTTAPSYYTNYLTDIASAGRQAVAKPADQLVAPLTAMQQQGYAAVPTAAEAYKPQLGAAEQTVGQVASGISPQNIQNFMNPYTANVVNEMERLQQQNIQRNVMPQLKAGFVGSGGLGGQRYANATGQTLADMQSNLTGQQFGALSSGYQAALKAAMDEAQLRKQAAEIQGQLAGQEQQYGLTGAGAMTKAGAEQQAYQQAILDAPLKQATNAAALMRGYTIPTSATETFHGPKAGVYSPSPLSQIAGLGSMVGASAPYIEKLVNWAGSKLPSITGGTTSAGTTYNPLDPYGTGTSETTGGITGGSTDYNIGGTDLNQIGGGVNNPYSIESTPGANDYSFIP
jgi:hypothetical protein